MNVPDSVWRGLSWVFVFGLAFFSADATASGIERFLAVDPKPLPTTAVVAIQENVPAQATPPGLIRLLGTTAPEDLPPVANNGATGTTVTPSVKPAAAKVPSNLKLRGTMAGTGGGGLAMIDLNGQTQVVSVGQEIAGLVLTQVNTHDVYLEGNGESQILQMDSKNQPVTITPPPTTAATFDTSQPVVPANDPAVDSADPGAGAILTQRELRNILNNPQAFAGQGFKLKPVLREDKIVGMLATIPNASHPMARLGIQSGDIIKSLNGTPLEGPESLSSVYRILRNTPNLNFEVERAGQPEKVSVTLAE